MRLHALRKTSRKLRERSFRHAKNFKNSELNARRLPCVYAVNSTDSAVYKVQDLEPLLGCAELSAWL